MLPCAENLLPGTLWEYKNKLYISDGKKWTIASGDEELHTPSQSMTFISDFVEVKHTPRCLSPVKPRHRGRPKKEKKRVGREPSEYNRFIQTHMLNGTFENLNGQERMRQISKLFKTKASSLDDQV
jgi:hypothetical protein